MTNPTPPESTDVPPPESIPLQSPMPRSGILDREEPELADEADLPATSPAKPESVAGEEDPGAALDE